MNLLHNSLERIGMEKQTKSSQLLGYTKEELQAHIEGQFSEGMSWDNIHIDHIIPVKAFVENGITDPRIINHLSNLKPMFSRENLSKSWKYDIDEFEAYMRKFEPTFSTHLRQLSLLSYEPSFLRQ
jgi:hypothetical protein